MSGVIGGNINLNNGKKIVYLNENKMVKVVNTYKMDTVNHLNYNNNIFVNGLIHIKEYDKKEVLPRVSNDDNLILVSDSIIDNKKELINLLQVKKGYDDVLDSEIILLAYKKWGEDCTKYLVGDFAFVIYDKRTNNIFCARDHVGERTFYYYLDNNQFIFGTTINIVLSQINNVTLNERWITDYLALWGPLHISEYRESIYNEIKQLPPAHTMKISANNISFNKYWNPVNDVKKLKLKSHEEYKEAFLKIYTEAINCRIDTVGQVGIMVSGGLDSASIATIASKSLKKVNKPLMGYSFVPIEGCKERLFGRITNESKDVKLLRDFCGNIKLNFCRNDGIDPLTNLNDLIDIFEQPIKTVENSYWITGMAEQCSKDGVKVLLSGQYGNTSVSYGDFFVHIQTLISEGKFLQVIKEINAGSKYHNTPRKVVIKNVLKDCMPYGIRKIMYRKENEIEKRFELSPVKRDLIKKWNVEKRFDEGQFNIVIERRRTMKDIREVLVNEVGFAHIGIMDTKDSIKYGIVRRDPTKDKRVIEFILSLPSDEFVSNGEERFLIRNSMKGLLPEEIRTNWKNRGIQSADWIQRLQPHWNELKREIKQALDDEIIKKYFDINKLEKLLLKYDNIDDVKKPYEFKMLITALVFYRFLIINNISSEERYTMIV